VQALLVWVALSPAQSVDRTLRKTVVAQGPCAHMQGRATPMRGHSLRKTLLPDDFQIGNADKTMRSPQARLALCERIVVDRNRVIHTVVQWSQALSFSSAFADSNALTLISNASIRVFKSSLRPFTVELHGILTQELH